MRQARSRTRDAPHRQRSPSNAPRCYASNLTERMLALGAAPSEHSKNGRALACGTWQWGNRLLWGYSNSMDLELEHAFRVMKAHNCTFFDTGDSYGLGKYQGRAESLLGQFSSRCPEPRTIAATKIAPYPNRVTSRSFFNAFSNSLKRISPNNECTAIAQVHWSTKPYLLGSSAQDRQMWDGLLRCYSEGLAASLGVSNYGPKQLKEVHDFLSRSGAPLLSVQAQFSLLSRKPEWTGLIEKAHELGVQVIGYSPLALGILPGKREQLPGLRRLGFQRALENSTALLELMSEIAAQHGEEITLAQVALAWVCGKGVLPIVGFKSAEQAEQNAGAVNVVLTEGEMAELDAMSARIPNVTQNPFTSD